MDYDQHEANDRANHRAVATNHRLTTEDSGQHRDHLTPSQRRTADAIRHDGELAKAIQADAKPSTSRSTS